MLRKLPLLLVLLTFISPAHAQSSKAEKALQCSAIYHIATAAYGGKHQAANAFMSIQRLFEGVFSVNERQRLNRTITNGMISKKKAQIEMELAKTYDRNPQSIYALEMQCNAWREKLAPYVINKLGQKPDRRKIQSVFLSVPDVPPMPSSSHPRWSQSKMMMDKSFSAWAKTGRMTTENLKQKLKDSLNKSGKSNNRKSSKVAEFCYTSSSSKAETTICEMLYSNDLGPRFEIVDTRPKGKGKLDGKGLLCKGTVVLGGDPYVFDENWHIVFYRGHVLRLFIKTDIPIRLGFTNQGEYTETAYSIKWAKETLNRASLKIESLSMTNTSFACKLQSPMTIKIKFKEHIDKIKSEMKKNKL